MEVGSVTPLLLTYNERENINRVLAQLAWAKRIVVVDSFSTDGTVDFVQGVSNAVLYQREFDTHVAQWNFGLSRIDTEWVLALDADYFCTNEFCEELKTLTPTSDVYFATFAYSVLGRLLPASLYPPRAVLFRPSQCKYTSDGHTQVLDIEGCSTSFLSRKIIHDDRKSLARWFNSQLKYAELEADKLLLTVNVKCGWKDRIRKRPFLAPALVLVYCLIAKRMVMCGRAGLYYTAQRVFAELLLSLVLLDRKLRA